MDKLFFDGNIITMAYKDVQEEINNSPEAVLVRDGIIYKIGKYDDLKVLAEKKCEEIDLKGRCLMPAFIDSHSHFMLNGRMAACVDLSECNSFAEIVDTLNGYIKSNKIKSDQAVVGFGYDHNYLKEKRHPGKTVLDQVNTQSPIMILHVSLHLACVNTIALNIANVDKDTLDPRGGKFGRITGATEPDGYLEEAAMQFVQGALSPFMKFNTENMINMMQDMYLKNGITTVQEGAATVLDWQKLKVLSDDQKLKLDVVAYPLISENGEEIMHQYGDAYKDYKNNLKIGGYKLILDGSPQGKSAWMSEPYEGEPKDYCGYPWMDNESALKYVTIALKEGKQLLVHCNGDAASEQLLNSYEMAIENTDIRADLRPVMIHCQTVRDDQLDRMANIKMLASIFVGHVWYWGDVHMKNFGIDRGKRISPVGSALDRGVHVSFHQDAPVTKPNMLHSIWCAVNRISRNGNVIGNEQSISVYNALKAATIEGAYLYSEENVKGTIEEGKFADLIILDKSPLNVASGLIRNIQVLETYKEGQRVW